MVKAFGMNSKVGCSSPAQAETCCLKSFNIFFHKNTRSFCRMGTVGISNFNFESVCVYVCIYATRGLFY